MVHEWHEYSNTAKTLFKERPLKVMDVGCGAGGFSAGLESTGSFKATWGIDINVDAACAYEKNFPEATVFAKDVEDFARIAIENLDKLNEDVENKPVFIETPSGERQIPAVGTVECMLIATPW
jgi:predicted RNA methylase